MIFPNSNFFLKLMKIQKLKPNYSKTGILSVLAGCKCKATLFTFCLPSQGREHVNKLALYLQPTSPDKMPGRQQNFARSPL